MPHRPTKGRQRDGTAAKKEVMIEPGDAVAPNSGGYLMTVEAVFDSGWVRCVWFSDGEIHADNFQSESLRRWFTTE